MMANDPMTYVFCNQPFSILDEWRLKTDTLNIILNAQQYMKTTLYMVLTLPAKQDKARNFKIQIKAIKRQEFCYCVK